MSRGEITSPSPESDHGTSLTEDPPSLMGRSFTKTPFLVFHLWPNTMKFYVPIVLPPWSLDKVWLRSYFWWELDNEGGEAAPFDLFKRNPIIFKTTVPFPTLKFSIDIQNSHFWKKIHFPISGGFDSSYVKTTSTAAFRWAGVTVNPSCAQWTPLWFPGC